MIVSVCGPVCARRRGPPFIRYWLSFFHFSLLILIKNMFETFFFDDCTPSFTTFCPFGPGRADASRLLLQFGAGPGTMPNGQLWAVSLGYAAAFAIIGEWWRRQHMMLALTCAAPAMLCDCVLLLSDLHAALPVIITQAFWR